MRINTFFAKKKSAQAMVEFAIALPVLLFLLYGILEAGRLLFLYSTVVTASRQAVRYGSATGDGGGPNPIYGAPRPVVPRYQDCAGIRGAANKVGYLGAFDTITLQYDTGPSTTQHSYCPVGQNSDSSLNTSILEGNRTRLVVTVQKEFYPIVPKLLPFIQRTISASSARTILYSVPIVVEQPKQEWFKNPTTLEITLDDPDPSEINQTVKVNFKLTGGSPAPTGVVRIEGADTNCPPVTIDSSGLGTCDVVFATAGAKVITAFYDGDDNSLASSDAENHTVTLYNTKLTITAPKTVIKDQPFAVQVTVTGGPTPTGTVTVTGGPGDNCSPATINLSVGMGSCAISFNKLGAQTITATYSGDSQHLGATATFDLTVLAGTPTPTSTPTRTPIPTPTLSPTPTLTPTPIATKVPSCTGISAPGGITLSGDTMRVTINNSNPYAFTLTIKDLTVTWNSDKGHSVGNKTLDLLKITVGATTIWTGPTINQYTLTVLTNAKLPPGNTVITFYFSQTYDNRDGTENVLINWLTPGCESNSLNIR
jgi:hypothetical protein